MHCFIFKRQPKSYNSWKKESTGGLNYKSMIETSFTNYNGLHTMLVGDVYGAVYYFYKKDTGTDADNISKPIWDCLTKFLFDDDKQVKLRLAGCFDISKGDFSELDVTGLPGTLIVDLAEAIETEDFIVYVECGALKNSFYKFNIENNGN